VTNIHLKTAWDNIRRMPFQAMAAIFVLAVTFFVITVLTILLYSSSQALHYFETRPQVIAFLESDATETDIELLRLKLNSDPRVQRVNYVSKEQALEFYKEATADNPLLSELVSPSIFPASLEFSLSDLSYAEEMLAEIKGEDVVERVGFTASLEGESALPDVVNKLRSLTWYLRVGGGIFAGIMAGTSFLVLLVIIGMRITTRRDEIEILYLLGATPAFIRKPILIEAMIYGIAGVVLGWMAVLLIILYATPTLISYFGEIPVLPRETGSLLYLFAIILAAELVIGTLIAFVGSMLAVSRVSRK
jgi:cell division transport system permease protein